MRFSFQRDDLAGFEILGEAFDFLDLVFWKDHWRERGPEEKGKGRPKASQGFEVAPKRGDEGSVLKFEIANGSLERGLREFGGRDEVVEHLRSLFR
jgi:hypothetical protein